MKPVSGQFAHSQVLQRTHSDYAPSLRHRGSRIAVQDAEARAVSVAKAKGTPSAPPVSGTSRGSTLNIVV